MASNAITIESLSHSYGQRAALDAVSFSVEAGQFQALLGPNGAGKTTLFSLLTRLLKPQTGRISVFGHDLGKAPRAALATMGVVFQQPTLDLDLSVMQNLAYHGAIQGLRPAYVRERAESELRRVELWERKDERVRALNGGHRRRVEIARALLHRPRLVLLDEASAGLDLESRTALYRHVRELCDSEGLTVLWTTHLVEELSDDDAAVLLRKGSVAADGRLSDLVTERGLANANELLLALSGGH